MMSFLQSLLNLVLASTALTKWLVFL